MFFLSADPMELPVPTQETNNYDKKSSASSLTAPEKTRAADDRRPIRRSLKGTSDVPSLEQRQVNSGLDKEGRLRRCF